MGQGPGCDGLQRAGDDAVDAAVQRLTHAAFDQFGRAVAVADLGQVGLRQAGQDSDGENLRVMAAAAAHGSQHHLGLGVDRQQVAATLGHGAGRTFDLGPDVVQFPVLEHRLAHGPQLMGEGDAAGAGQQAEADLVAGDDVADGGHHGPGRLD